MDQSIEEAKLPESWGGEGEERERKGRPLSRSRSTKVRVFQGTLVAVLGVLGALTPVAGNFLEQFLGRKIWVVPLNHWVEILDKEVVRARLAWLLVGLVSFGALGQHRGSRHVERACCHRGSTDSRAQSRNEEHGCSSKVVLVAVAVVVIPD